MDGPKSFLTARYGYLFVMIATILVGIISFIRAMDHHWGDRGSYMIAAAIAFGAATLASKSRS